MGVSRNRGPSYSTLKSWILIRTLKIRYPLIFGNSQIPTPATRRKEAGSKLSRLLGVRGLLRCLELGLRKPHVFGDCRMDIQVWAFGKLSSASDA